jgi:hypothetical protein
MKFSEQLKFEYSILRSVSGDMFKKKCWQSWLGVWCMRRGSQWWGLTRYSAELRNEKIRAQGNIFNINYDWSSRWLNPQQG